MLRYNSKLAYLAFTLTFALFPGISFTMEDTKAALVEATVNAIQFGHLDALKIALNAGGNPNETTSSGIPLLCMLAEWKNMGEQAIVQVNTGLLYAHAHIDAQTPKSKNTTLHIALTNDCFLVAKALIDRGANRQLPNQAGVTPDMLLAKCDKKEAQQLIPVKICYSNKE